MSAAGIEWIAVLLFAILFVAAIGAEILWLSKKGWATTGKAAAFAVTTNLISFGIGSFLVFTLAMVAFMLVMGWAGRGSNTPQLVYVAIIIAAVLILPLISIAFKRIMLAALKIRTGRVAWLYSLAASLIFLLVVIFPPPLMLYIAASIWK
jgi:hypothetical protein